MKSSLTSGGRSLADEMSGGDLDGDEFALIWNKDLVNSVGEHFEAASYAERRRLTGATCKKPTPTPVDEKSRDEAAAYHLVRTRRRLHMIGVVAHQWLLVAETHGAADDRSKILSYLYSDALDAGKAGGAPITIPRECELTKYPQHLRRAMPSKWDGRRFCVKRSSALAQINAIDATGAMPPCVEPEPIWQGLLHPVYAPDSGPGHTAGARYAEFKPLLEKWERLYAEYRRTCREGGSWEDTEKGSKWQDIVEEYRQHLLDGHTEAQIEYP